MARVMVSPDVVVLTERRDVADARETAAREFARLFTATFGMTPGVWLFRIWREETR